MKHQSYKHQSAVKTADFQTQNGNRKLKKLFA